MNISSETREILDKIDEFLAKGNADSQDLWDILTALRGPDSENDIKHVTTIPIRNTALPKTTKVAISSWGFTNGADFRGGEFSGEDASSDTSEHFSTHVIGAARLLGIY